MKKLLSFLGVCLCVTSAMADTPVMLVFQTNDGNTHHITAAGTQISFTDGQLSAKNGDNSVSLPLDKLDKMYFSGIESAEMVSTDEISGPVSAYTIDGTFAGEFSSLKEACKRLAHGLYVFKNDKSSLKLQIQ